MAEIIGSRLEQLIADRDTNQSALARIIGVSQPSIGRLISGETRESGKLLELARALATTPEYLVGETDDPELGGVAEKRLAWRGPDKPNPDLVELNEFDLAYGLGASYIHDVPVTGKLRSFSREWVRQFTDSPMTDLFWARGLGDSMTPTIQDADVVLVDTGQRTPMMWDKLWAVEVGGMGMIKRLRPTKDGGGMRLLSSNTDVPEEVVYDGEMNVIGRVVAIVRKV